MLEQEDRAAQKTLIQGAIALVKRGDFKAVILTMGEQGVAYSEDGVQGEWLPAFVVDAIDTVAAGDCFNGALAAAMVDGASFRDSFYSRWQRQRCQSLGRERQARYHLFLKCKIF